MKTITLNCAHCTKEFQKSLKEHTRRVKEGYNTFYCSRSCSGHNNLKYLPSPNREQGDHLRKITKLAADANRKYTKEESTFNEYIRRALRRDKQNVDLSIEHLVQVWNAQSGKCAISNIPIEHFNETTNKNQMASLDRIDSSKGYVIGNVQFLSYPLNLAKNDRTDEELKQLLNLVRLHS